MLININDIKVTLLEPCGLSAKTVSVACCVLWIFVFINHLGVCT